MPKYLLLEAAFLNGVHHAKGSTVEWDGPPSLCMDPVDDAARKIFAEHEAKYGRRGRNYVGNICWGGDNRPFKLAPVKYEPVTAKSDIEKWHWAAAHERRGQEKTG